MMIICSQVRDIARLVLICSLAAAAHAQQDESKPSNTRAAGKGVIEEVLVTTSKREESLMDVLGSVSAVSSEELARSNIQDYQRLAELIPGMVVLNEESVAIRGISRSREGPSPIAFHVNDVFLAQRGEPFYDMESIEIVRGPSGTVFGRNATAGAINAKWKRPDNEFSWGANFRYSSLTEEQIRGYVNFPLFEVNDRPVLARFAAMSRRGDGRFDNLLAPDDEDPGNFDDQFIRMYLTSELTDNLQVALRAIRYDSDPHGAAFVRTPTLLTRQSGDLERGGAEPLPLDLLKVRSNIDETYGEPYTDSRRVSLEVDWAVHDVPVLGSFDTVFIGGYQWGDASFVFDLDGTEAQIFDARNIIDPERRRSAELRFVSTNNTGIEWLLGLFWYKGTVDTDLDAVVTAAPSTGQTVELVGPSFLPRIPPFPGDPGLLITVPVLIESFSRDESKAVYINYNFDMAELLGWSDIQITAGVRRNFDEFESGVTSSNVSDPSFEFARFIETTGELGVRWFYNADGMLYTKISRGYKPGLSQVRTDEAGNTFQNPVDPEFLDAIELGWKAAFLDRTLQMELAAFYYDYQDLQVTQLGPPSGIITTNAAAATIFGIELGLNWSPTEQLRVNFSASAMEAGYDDYCSDDPATPRQETPDPGCTENNPTDFSGERTQAAPPFSLTLTANYTFSLGSYGSLVPSIKTSWTDELERRGLGNPHDVVDGYTATDIRLTWNSPARRWSVEAFVENLEDNNDKFFTAFGRVLSAGGSPNTFTLGDGLPPRIFGVSVTVQN